MKNFKVNTENDLAVLFTCIGRRVSLLQSFRRAAGQLKIDASFFGADTTELSPALQLCDRRFLVKPTTHKNYIGELLSIVKANHVRLLVPTVDLDLRSLSRNAPKFAAAGCRVLVSSPDVIDTCQDKRKTYKFLLKNSFDTPATLSIRTALKNSQFRIGYPCFLKPWDGSAGKGNAIAKNRRELSFYAKKIPNAICQELAEVNPKIKVDVYDFVRDAMKAREFRVDKIPAIAVIGLKDYGIRFYGIPSGYEFTSLIGTILDVSRGDSGLAPKNRELIKNIDRQVHLQVFVTPTCPVCPSAVRGSRHSPRGPRAPAP